MYHFRLTLLLEDQPGSSSYGRHGYLLTQCPLCKGPESDQELFLKSHGILYFRWHRIAPVSLQHSLTEACQKLHTACFPATTTCTIESVASCGLVPGLLVLHLGPAVEPFLLCIHKCWQPSVPLSIWAGGIFLQNPKWPIRTF